MANPTRQFDPQFAAAINQQVQQGVDPNTAAMQLLQQRGMSPVDANTWWSFNQGAYKVDPQSGRIGEHKSAIDNPWIKAAVLAPMIAGGGFAAAGALGAGGGAAGGLGSSPELAAGGDLAGLGGAGAVGPGGAALGEAGGLAGGATTAADITGELAPSSGIGAGGVAGSDEALGNVAGGGFTNPGQAGGWHSLLNKGSLLNAGLNVGGAALSSHAAGKAAQQQAQAAQQALNLQQNLYNRGSAALMPYYQLGAGSLGRLGSFLGTKPAAPLPELPAGPISNLGK